MVEFLRTVSRKAKYFTVHTFHTLLTLHTLPYLEHHVTGRDKPGIKYADAGLWSSDSGCKALVKAQKHDEYKGCHWRKLES